MTRNNGGKARAQKPKTREQSLREKRERIKAASVAGGPQLRSTSVVSVKTAPHTRQRKRKPLPIESVVVKSISREWVDAFDVDKMFEYFGVTASVESIIAEDAVESEYEPTMTDNELAYGEYWEYLFREGRL